MAQGISETYHEAKKDLEACAEKVGTSMVQYVAKGADVAAKVEDISSGALASAAGLGKGALKLGGAALATTVGNTIYHNIRSDPEKNERVKAAQHANTRAKMSNDGFKAQQREEQAFNAANDIVNNIVRPALEEGKAHVAVYCNDQALISNFKTLLANDRELRDQIGQLSFGVELQRLISKLEGVLEEDEQRYQAQRDTPPIRKAYVFLSYTGTAASDGMMMHGGRGRMGPRFSKMGTIVGELSGGQYRHAISGDFEYTQPDGKRLPLRKVDPAQLYRLLLVCPLFIKHAYLVDFRAHVANRSLGHGVSGTLFSAAGRAKTAEFIQTMAAKTGFAKTAAAKTAFACKANAIASLGLPFVIGAGLYHVATRDWDADTIYLVVLRFEDMKLADQTISPSEGICTHVKANFSMTLWRG